MLSESAARDLLVQAGETIDVPPGMPDLPPAPPRRWPVLAAAAAVVVAVLAATGVVALQRDTDTSPSGEVTVPRVDFQAYSPSLTAGQIPSVFAYDGASARSMLEGLGLTVTVEPDYVCNTPGRATRTNPRVGTTYSAGHTVTLFVTEEPPTARCAPDTQEDLAWQLLDFANGRGPAPAFADEVWVAANGESAEIPASLAADPTAWVDGTPLGVLRQLSQEAHEVIGSSQGFETPQLFVSISDPASSCHGDLSGVPRNDQGVSIGIAFIQDGAEPCTTVDIFRTNGLIGAISLRTVRVPAEVPDPSVVPNVTRLTEDEARTILEGQGLAVETIPPPGTKLCLLPLPPIVGNQTPQPGTRVDPGSVVTIALRWVSCEESPATGTSP